MSETSIDGLDHGIIGVEDLEAAYKIYEKLGFTLTRRGRHEGWGTANYCIMFEGDYLEILGIVDPDQFDAGLVPFLSENGEGLMKIVARSSDAPKTKAYLAKNGFEPSDIQKLGRWLEMPEGDVMPHFQLVHLPQEKTPAFKGFICQHLTPELVWRKEWLTHSNTAKGITAYLIKHDDPAALKDVYERLFGRPAELVEGRLTVETGQGKIIFATATELSVLLPDYAADKEAKDGQMLAMIISVSSLDQTANVLKENAVPFIERKGKEIFLAPENACGAALLFQD